MLQVERGGALGPLGASITLRAGEPIISDSPPVPLFLFFPFRIS